ncbi:peptide chain release factor 2 [Staphylococcus pseudintermedius]|uniref:Peptide chain release factor 2 n=2 Tax=Staphylococcus pseudintermedius TaxID=283734 RepID=A0A3D8ZET4_STAPS|nr:peptide chain release factor 2 [Staphylococcus pseudintermedius]EGQ1589512.1 peptide chain release factor 2 [Staphylococcus pseudintermedius]EGQ1677566.1 peptide chain release factor 2 [Staphylococcus pseudintermedius]EGQ1752809.1 peptide chain release factor 2 [Staphylococcus pseudintermedius]EGQ2702350.1 peptide chain release factor 2 [Staphylococcus pseudintermedius]EGQ2961213.1 peptide chain release factor 2 [Staphylococcus pseudintermedius]
MELSELKRNLDSYSAKIEQLRGSLDLENKETNIQEYEEMMADPQFWDNQERAQTIIDQNNAIKSVVNNYYEVAETLEEMAATYELLQEEYDDEMKDDLEQEVIGFQTKVDQFELQLLLDGEHDANNAILELHPGAGGTESQDWTNMLLRMYQRYCEQQGFKVEIVDYQAGDEAGVKSVTMLVKGHNAYGYLKAEKGVHRLVRISPFDSSGRRHTSFASCDVIPEFNNEKIEVEINPDDITVDTFRASGAGGQHINKTESAIRITHHPTGIVVNNQNERSQIKNREAAMKMLKAKLYQLELEQKEQELAAIRGEQKEIGWGSQIRSYVFHPYSMVKDHRTNEETGNVNAVMDGEIGPFIEAYLRHQMQ